MRKYSIIILALIFVGGCAKRIPLAYDQIEKNALIKVNTLSGKSVEGIVKSKQSTLLILQSDRDVSSLHKVNRNDITNIAAKPFVLDYQNKVISEWDIKDNQDNQNVWLYTIGGAGLSFGASFFVGSLLHRAMSESDSRDAALWGTTAAGTALGTYLFLKTGKSKDRQASIMELREARYEVARKEMQLEKRKHEQIQHELKSMKTAREKQNSEIKRLQERLKKREKMHDPEGDK